MEQQKASHELCLFFEKLLEIKQFVFESAKKLNDPLLHEIYEKLDSVIKETGK
jgi:hypothetical protein